MRTATAGLIALLNNNNAYMMADLYTVTLVTGEIYRWTSADTDLTLSGNVFSCAGPLIKRGITRLKVGIEVDTLDITIKTDENLLMLSKPIPSAAANGALDGARIKLERVFMPTWGDTGNGSLILFEGIVAGVEPSRYEVRLTIKSELDLLNIPMPYVVYKPACAHSVYDTGCGLLKSSFNVSSSVAAGSSTTVINSALPQPVKYFELGVLVFTSGVNAGVRRAVKSFSSGSFTLAMQLPVAPNTGDAFTVYPGCDRTLNTCKTKFNNANRFRGFPYVPRPEQAR